MKHFNSQAHSEVLEHIKRLKKDTMPKCIIQLNERQISTTCKVFRTVYSIAKRNLPFAQVTKSIELQMLNGVDMGVGLHSRQTAVSIVDGIATDIKKLFLKKLYNKI